MTGKKKGSKEKEERTCNHEMRGKICGRPLYDDEHCIFHSNDVEGKSDLFDEAIKKEINRQDEHEDVFNFMGFVFPEELSFNFDTRFGVRSKYLLFQFPLLHPGTGTFLESIDMQ